MLSGWQKYKNCADKRIRDRFGWEMRMLKSTYAGAVWAMTKRYQKDKALSAKMNRLLHDLYREFGLKTRLIAPVLGRYLYNRLKLEENRLGNGFRYEPPWFFEKNQAALDLENAQLTPTVAEAAKLRGHLTPQAPALNR